MTRIVKKLVLLITILQLSLFAGTVTGKITEIESGKPLEGANVTLDGTQFGAATDAKGIYQISNIPNGTYIITVSVIGFEKESRRITVTGVKKMNFELIIKTLNLSELEVMASRADRSTPVAFSNLNKRDIEFRLGSQDIPLILNTTPSVYSTTNGGGAGDARVNVRGFNQRNIAIMINGVPVNDMENGWVYWSNWDGVADATSSIQMQRGLSAVNLATPSIGGTMNIITDPAGHKRGYKVKLETGAGNFKKSTFSYHSGLINDKLAFGATVVRKTGEGLIDKTWTDAWAYYLGVSLAVNKKHRLELYALGAPQRHGQNRYKQNIASYDSTFAKSLKDYDPAAIAEFPQSSSGRFYNENWNTVSPTYTGKQYYYMYGARTIKRHDANYLNEKENYFHKPQVNLNWFWTLNQHTRLSSLFYYSGGSGGGSGTFGDIVWDYDSEPSRIANWDATIAVNIDTLNRKDHPKPANEAVGYLRNSINRQWTLGAISKLNYNFSKALKFQFGIDWRTAEIEHAREVRDLLGGTYAINGRYENSADLDSRYSQLYNEFDETYEDAKVTRGDYILYHNTNTVDWIGTFGQFEYNSLFYSFYGMFGISGIVYSYTDHFRKALNHAGYDSTASGELLIKSNWITSTQFKGGALVHLSDEIDIFSNLGVVEKVPIFDSVIDDFDLTLSTSPKNEKFISTEIGLNYTALSGLVTAKFNLYNTDWKNRSLTRLIYTGTGSTGGTDIIFLTGLGQNHKGIEAEIAYKPIDMIRFDAALSFGLWEFKGDAEGTYKNYDDGSTTDYTYAVDGLKVGDMPQTIIALGALFYPFEGLTVQGVLNWYDRHYADWDPASRIVIPGVDPDRTQSWQAPGFAKIDVHGYYKVPLKIAGTKIKLFFHIFNLLDEINIQDAVDNSRYNAYTANGLNHKADDAEVYLGLPRTFNAGITISR